MNILAIDSSAKAASAAVVSEEAVLASFHLDVKLTHSQTLMPMCQQVLACAGLTMEDIHGIAVSKGPGSFTGLRIGMAAVKGLAFAKNLPCVGVSTLKSLAYNLQGFEGIACAVMDARRNQVYNALFALRDGTVSRLCEDRAISVEELKAELSDFNQPVFLVGDGAQLCLRAMPEFPRLRLAPLAVRTARAASVGVAALPDFLSGNTVDAETLMPAYLRLPQAQRELLEREGKTMK